MTIEMFATMETIDQALTTNMIELINIDWIKTLQHM